MTNVRRLKTTVLLSVAVASVAGVFGKTERPASAREPHPAASPGWQKGKGWGWIWGKDDEVGSLNAMTDATRAAAMATATKGQTFDLGLTYSRRSFKWPGHNPGEIISFRSPEGIDRMADPDAPPAASNPDKVFWHSSALFLSDNVATQIDGLAHITAGADYHWYNGFKEAEWGGDFGPRKCDATTIPPIIARGVMIDVAAFKKVDALPGHTAITPGVLRETLAHQKTSLKPGDVVLIRTGTARFWATDGADHARLAEHDSAGINLDAAKWLIEDQGAILIGSDTSGLEVSPPSGHPGTAIPVHRYLLVDQGVHIGEFHNLEALSRERVYTFCYIATTNKIKGTVAGFALRPIAVR
jgi:kynurenine formamidase